jgi:NAD-dependent SIR2 family protein deacetylase
LDGRVCFLLGAGASAAAPSSIPTVSELLPELWRRARKLGRDDIDRLADWCDERDIRNIEDLLTAAYLANFAAKNSHITGMLDYFLFKSDTRVSESTFVPRHRGVPQVDAASIALLQDTLHVLFGLLTGTMIPAAPNDGHAAVVEFVKHHSAASIVTTNYDGCIDEALSLAGVPVATYVDESSARTEKSVDLLKIHGSINWSYCDSCHEVREFDLLQQKRAFNDDSHSYAVIGICKRCGGQRRPLLIPPLGFKFVMFPNLIRLWNSARERIEASELIVVVGYSFSEADGYVNKIIERSMTVNAKQRLIIIDTNFSLVETLRSRYSARIDGFDQKRILRGGSSGNDWLPRVLPALCGLKKFSHAGAIEAATSDGALTVSTPILGTA